ncbi:hypothetical protein JTB14_015222 [Gonioctena quinquepunctata]|nr:hypothetical protein JTB14_015222 [Gonioctena quinquepunctata]
MEYFKWKDNMLLCFLLGLLDFSESVFIVNGNHEPIEPDLGEVPFQANLMLHVNNTYSTFCGGSLIHPSWILTAAHCFEQDGESIPVNLINVALGSVYTNGRGAQRIAERIVMNKKYFETDDGHDVGLIKLKSNATLNSNVKLIQLHTNNNESLIGKRSFLTGFGFINDFYQRPTKLRKAILHIDSPEKCLMDTNSVADICCSSSIAEGKACKGDSGGPLTIINNGKYIQVGITSHLTIPLFCRMSFNNSIYTRVSAYISWISKFTGIDFSKFNQS